MLNKYIRFARYFSSKSLPEYLSCKYSKMFFEKNSMVLIEGEEQIFQVLEAGGILKKIFHLNDAELGSLPKSNEIVYEKLDRDSMKHISRLNNNIHSIAGLFKRPTNEVLESSNISCLNLSIIADELQDHVNLGTLIKNAALAGCKRVLVMKGSANLWSPRTVRAAGASYFQIPVYKNCLPDTVNKYISADCNLYVADLPANIVDEKPLIFDRVDWSQESALVVGNEFRGISEHYRTKVLFGEAQYVHIPQHSTLNSLSAATTATIIAFEALRQSSAKTF